MSVITYKGTFASAQPHHGQPESGPGGADYQHQSVAFYDHATRADGFWLFEPADPKPDSAEVIVFLHGYGAYNPMTYGKWIKHLVAKGNIVIFPRYQRNLVFPRPNGFPPNAAVGIRDAITLLQTGGDHVRPKLDKVVYIGHSYGGVIASNLGVYWQKYGVPKPAAMLLAEPGSGPFSGARLTDYKDLPPDLNLLVVVGEDDVVVGAEFAAIVYNTAVNTPRRNFLVQRRDMTGPHWILATHSEPYSYDLDFDNGVRNYTALRVLSTSRVNEVDFFCYWKLGDALIDFTRKGTNEHVAFGNTPEQRFMGFHPDGRMVRPLDVYLPPAQIRLRSRRSATTADAE